MDNLLLVFALAALPLVILYIWTNVSQRRAHDRRMRAIELADVDYMSGTSFEFYVAELYQHFGYSTQLTTGSNDFGVDIVASKPGERIAIQVKRRSNKVSRTAVSDAVAGMRHYGCNCTAVVTNSYFSPGAHKLAHSNGCRLIDRDKLAEWILSFQSAQANRRKPPKVEWSSLGLDEHLEI